MPTNIEDYLQLHYRAVVLPDESTEGETVYLASHPDLPGCMAHGATADEALQNLGEARELYIRALIDRGLKVPEPANETTVVWREFRRSRPTVSVTCLTGSSAVLSISGS